MSSAHRDSARKSHRLRRRPSLESLEGRKLMSLGAEFVAPVNTTTLNAQFDSHNASSANGSSVVVWVHTFSSTDHDIKAQRYDPFGNKVGSEITVAGSSRDDTQPAVAMDSFGNFVVTWRQTQANGDTNVLAQRFNALGVPIGSNVQVGVGTFHEHDPSVAMDDAGRFIVAYVRDTNNNNPDVFAKRYDAGNNLLNVINVGVLGLAETNPSIAATPDGRFDIAWEKTFSASDHDILLNRYSSAAALLGTSFIDISAALATNPSVSMNVSGDAVVAFQFSSGSTRQILAKKAFANGVTSAPITIASTTSLFQTFTAPSAAMKRTGTSFVVAYQSNALLLPFAPRVRVAEVTPNGSIFADNDAGTNRSAPAVSMNGFGRYVVTYTSNDSGDLNIRRRMGVLTV